MRVEKLQVFIASRFDEFAELRQALVARIRRSRNPPAEPIDLNDNYPSSQPPLDRCYEAIDDADIVVLLIGETYGTKLGDDKSYTHHEFLRAVEGRKTILPFFIRPRSVKSHPNDLPADPVLRAWFAEVAARYTICFLDSREGADKICAEIYDGPLLDYLLEGADRAGIVAVASREDILRDEWDRSPIALRELVKPLQSKNGGNRLRSLASEHVAEAFGAIAAFLPSAAIHHLTQAYDLVRLELVPAYWLARLLVDTGTDRRGRRIAEECIALAERQAAPPVTLMACRILAARAHERARKRTVAVEYAQKAEAGLPYHWLGKFELGRQYAIDRAAAEATEYARQAFWLRPPCIYQIRADPAYIGLGQSLRNFLAQLQEDAAEEARRVIQCEKEIFQFAGDINAGDIETPHDLSVGSSVLGSVNSARASARKGLNLLRRCASKLALDVENFAAGPFRHLTIATRNEIEETIVHQRAKIDSLHRRLKELTTKAAQAQEIMRSIAGGGVFCALIFAVMLYLAIESEAGGWAVLLALALVVTAGITWTAGYAKWTQHVTARAHARELDEELAMAHKTLALAKAASADFNIQQRVLRELLMRFSQLVSRFEWTAGKRLAYAPAVSRYRQNTTDLVRIDEQEPGDDKNPITKEPNLIPAALAEVAGDALPPKYWFARRVRANDVEVFSRSAAYFG